MGNEMSVVTTYFSSQLFNRRFKWRSVWRKPDGHHAGTHETHVNRLADRDPQHHFRLVLKRIVTLCQNINNISVFDNGCLQKIKISTQNQLLNISRVKHKHEYTCSSRTFINIKYT